MRKKSFRDLYNEYVKSHKTPRQQFLQLVCEITGASPSTISMWLSGYYTPENEISKNIAKYFDVDPAGLFTEQRTKKNKSRKN